MLCVLLLKHLSKHAFHNKRFQTLFIDQLTLTIKGTVSLEVALLLVQGLRVSTWWTVTARPLIQTQLSWQLPWVPCAFAAVLCTSFPELFSY